MDGADHITGAVLKVDVLSLWLLDPSCHEVLYGVHEKVIGFIVGVFLISKLEEIPGHQDPISIVGTNSIIQRCHTINFP